MARRAEATHWMLIKQGDKSRYVSVSKVGSYTEEEVTKMLAVAATPYRVEMTGERILARDSL